MYIPGASVLLLSIPTVLAQDRDYSYVGGVSLRYPSKNCPNGTVYGGTSLQANCCPDGQFIGPSGSAYCCPTEVDCGKEVLKAPKCADPSWEYCYGPPYGFCCLQDWTCVHDAVGGVGCSPPGSMLKTDQTTGSTVYQANEGPTGTISASITSSSSSIESGSRATIKPSITSNMIVVPSADSLSPTSSSTASTPQLSTSDKIALGLGIGFGIPAALTGVITAYIACRNYVRKKKSIKENRKKPQAIQETTDTEASETTNSQTLNSTIESAPPP